MSHLVLFLLILLGLRVYVCLPWPSKVALAGAGLWYVLALLLSHLSRV